MEDSGHGFPTWDVTREGGEEGTTSHLYLDTTGGGNPITLFPLLESSTPCWQDESQLPPQPGCAEFDWQV